VFFLHQPGALFLFLFFVVSCANVLLNVLAAKGEGVVIGRPAMDKVGAVMVVILCSRGLWQWQ
jgi:hypothetical protein